MTRIVRTNAHNLGFMELVKNLDADLAERDGEDHAYYGQFNKLDRIKHVVILYDNKKPVCCGAIKEYQPHVMELKRMYTLPESRGKGFANKILSELEKWASELHYKKCILETERNNLRRSNYIKRTGTIKFLIMVNTLILKTVYVLKRY